MREMVNPKGLGLMAVVLAKGWTQPVVFTRPPPSISAEQLALFPRSTLIELPTRATADIYKYVQADNKRYYYLKLDKEGRYARANEWLCYRLANLVGVSTPRCDFIQTFNGDIAFGSEGVVGAASEIDTFLYLQTHSMNEIGQPIAGLQERLSAIHTFDLFINNVDRHMRNFLVLGAGDERQLIAMDFARSLFWKWPLDGFPSPGEETGKTWIELRERHGFDLGAARLVLDRLSMIGEIQLAPIVSQMPSHWLPIELQEALLAYCREGRWKARVAALRRGLESGSIV